MTAFTNYVVVPLAMLIGGAAGSLVRPRRGRLEFADICLVLSSLVVAWFVMRDPWPTLALALLLSSVYLQFNHWRFPAEGSLKGGLDEAFRSLIFIVGFTARNWQEIVLAFIVGYALLRVGVWANTRGYRVLGIALLLAASCVQLARVPLLRSADSLLGRYLTTAHV
ncbi:MAG TPA: hypothetical protein VHV51_15195 [Polyangiaceae bacterium]|jgi:hypothetical protein|nr:hypothetical protein [Polyangiaceae bacterium]